MKRLAALALCLLLGLALAWWASATPAPAPANASAGAFSAERAMRDVRVIAREPHPIGTAANARVRDYLVARFRELGLQVRVQPFTGEPDRWTGMGPGVRGENIVAVMRGRSATAPALVVMSHYDSARGSPGAADDAAGVAASLEIARALRAEGAPARDVIFLVTDGEEVGLMGAVAFFAGDREQRAAPDPLAARVGAVLNLEARGGGGRAFMFETGPQNGGMIGLLQANAVRPTSNSLAVFVYQNMPNGTDFGVARHLGHAGMNFAFIGRPAQYHTSASTPENLDRGSLQHIGEQVLAAGRAMAFSERLPAKAPDAVYSDVLGAFLVSHPAWVGWIGLAVAAGLSGYAVWRRRRAAPRVGWVDLLQGAGGAVTLMLAAALLMRLARRLTGLEDTPTEYYELLARFGAYETALTLVGVAAALLVFAAMARGGSRLWGAVGALVAGAACSAVAFDIPGMGLGAAVAVLAFAVGGRPLGMAGAWGGFLIVGLLLATVLQVRAPTTAFIVVWPLLASAATGAVYVSVRRRGICLAVAVVLGGVALGQLGAWAHGITLGIGATTPEALALFAYLGALAIAPLLYLAGVERAGRWAGAAVLVAGLALVLWIRFAGPSGMPAPVPYTPESTRTR